MARVHPRGGGGPEAGAWVAVAGTRPNYVKLAPLVRAAAAAGRRLHWIDAGQHTDPHMRTRIRDDAGLPAPDVSLEAPPAGPDRIATLAAQLVEPLAALAPSVVLVLGDVDATAAAARAAWQRDLPIAHVEAGLRCGDPGMPEERNRILVDALADRHYVTEPSALEHLAAEGLAPARHACEVGNVMADALLALDLAAAPDPVPDLPPRFVLATLHRQANVDDPARLAAFVDALAAVARAHGAVVWPVHPRIRARVGAPAALRARGLLAVEPLGYRPFLQLLRRADAVITDSGGVPVEAALLETPCVIARGVTEHRLSLDPGGAVLAGEDPRALPAALARALAGPETRLPRPRAWDGRAAERIVADLAAGFARPPRRDLPGGA